MRKFEYRNILNALREYSRELREFKATVFHALAHPTRIAIVDALRAGELSAGELITQLGLEQPNASQHLAILRTRGIASSRRAGNQVYYSLRDSIIIEVLDLLREYFYSHLKHAKSLLSQLDGGTTKHDRAKEKQPRR